MISLSSLFYLIQATLPIEHTHVEKQISVEYTFCRSLYVCVAMFQEIDRPILYAKFTSVSFVRNGVAVFVSVLVPR